MKKWKTGAITGAVYYLLGLLSVSYILKLGEIGMIVFLPTFLSGRVIYALINAIYTNSTVISTWLAMLLSIIVWALIGAGVGHLVEIVMSRL